MRNVLLVDDHPVVRKGIARILTSEIPDLRVNEAYDGAAALEHLSAGPCDLILLDLTLPGDSGLSLLRRIKRDHPAIPVVIVSMHPAVQFAQRTLDAGAVAYIAKNSDPHDIVRVVRQALAGKLPVPADAAGDPRTAIESQPHETLSEREYQVLRLIGTGRTVTEISADLGLSVKTVSTYRSKILEKMKLRTSAELMHYAIVNRLVP